MFKIRKAADSDHKEWLRMRKSLWPECPTDRHILEMNLMMSSDGIVLLAEVAGSRPVGFAEISIRNDHVEGTKTSPVPYLEGWYVGPDYRKKGIGKALIKAAEELALQEGYNEFASDVDIENKTGIELHKKVGFREVGRSVHFVKSI